MEVLIQSLDEAILGACWVIAWADGYRTDAEIDAYIALVAGTGVAYEEQKRLDAIWSKIDPGESIFSGMLDVLEGADDALRIMACVWMTRVAMISNMHNDCWIVIDRQKCWLEKEEFITPKEQRLLESAYKRLHVNQQAVKAALKHLAPVRKM